MKVLMFNGSPKAKGCTYTALEEMAKVLNEEGVETEIMHREAAWAVVDVVRPVSACTAAKL